MHSCCAILGNTAVMNDNKILLWVLGVIQPLIQMLQTDLDSYKQLMEAGDETKMEKMSLKRAEFALYVLW